MENIQVGTRVEILSNEYGSKNKIGSIGRVVKVGDDGDFRVDVDGALWWHKEDSVRIIAPVASALCDICKKPLGYSYLVAWRFVMHRECEEEFNRRMMELYDLVMSGEWEELE